MSLGLMQGLVFGAVENPPAGWTGSWGLSLPGMNASGTPIVDPIVGELYGAWKIRSGTFGFGSSAENPLSTWNGSYWVAPGADTAGPRVIPVQQQPAAKPGINKGWALAGGILAALLVVYAIQK